MPHSGTGRAGSARHVRRSAGGRCRRARACSGRVADQVAVLTRAAGHARGGAAARAAVRPGDRVLVLAAARSGCSRCTPVWSAASRSRWSSRWTPGGCCGRAGGGRHLRGRAAEVASLRPSTSRSTRWASSPPGRRGSRRCGTAERSRSWVSDRPKANFAAGDVVRRGITVRGHYAYTRSDFDAALAPAGDAPAVDGMAALDAAVRGGPGLPALGRGARDQHQGAARARAGPELEASPPARRTIGRAGEGLEPLSATTKRAAVVKLPSVGDTTVSLPDFAPAGTITVISLSLVIEGITVIGVVAPLNCTVTPVKPGAGEGHGRAHRGGGRGELRDPQHGDREPIGARDGAGQGRHDDPPGGGAGGDDGVDLGVGLDREAGAFDQRGGADLRRRRRW